MENHFVVLYIHDQTKRFTVTARMMRARLLGVTEQMTQLGYRVEREIANLTKLEANAERDRIRDEYIGRGYTYQTRQPLS